MFNRKRIRALEYRVSELEEQKVYLPVYLNGTYMETRSLPLKEVVQGMSLELDMKLELGRANKVMKREEGDE